MLTATEPLVELVVLTLADAVGVETLPEACVALGETVLFVCADTDGVETDAPAEAAGGAVWTDVCAEAEAAGVETCALALADGVVEWWTVTWADAETGGGGGVPGSPSA